ncbi:MAG: glycoside-pentoside-hexuronide (GPH):cation symporter [Clostridia bacterium]|nr:glycoside-pentoside-hexuronide (GPH):cation symporter [Clostridia bacterium]
MKTKLDYQTSGKERVSYAMYFFGQNILWAYAGLVATFLLDIGIEAKVASAILLIPKIWDAVNDTLFGFIVDRTKFRNNQKFLPWIRIGTAIIGITTVIMFAISKNIPSTSMKLTWFLVSYLVFDAAYTMLDAPMYALPTAMTTNVQERTSLISSNRFTGMLGGLIATVLVPIVRPKTGWLLGAVIFCSFATAFMLPILFTGKERNTEFNEKTEKFGLKDMVTYLAKNRYLAISLALIFIIGVCSIETVLSLIVARNCLGSESMATVITAILTLPMIILAVFLPKICRRFDKVVVLTYAMLFGVAGCLIGFIGGYRSMAVVMVSAVVKGIGYSIFMIISYMLIPDAVEYGTYKSGIRATGISFSLQTFTSKLRGAIVGSIALFALGLFGYDSTLAEDVLQAQSVIDGIWTVYTLLPAVGYLVSFFLLLFLYKMRDRDVDIMTRANSGEITREEAETLLNGRI